MKGKETMLFSNARHPELLPDEVWIANDSRSAFAVMRWKTRRLGNIAFDKHGNPAVNDIPRLRPIFVSKEEVEKKDPNLLKALEEGIIKLH